MLLATIAHCLISTGAVTARADLPTGVQTPVAGPVSECSVPQPEPPSVYSVQLSSKFTYFVCRQFRASRGGTLYFLLGPAEDGEYIRLLAPPGRSAVDPDDYRRNLAIAVKTCRHIRDSVLQRAVALDKTSCQGQTLP